MSWKLKRDCIQLCVYANQLRGGRVHSWRAWNTSWFHYFKGCQSKFNTYGISLGLKIDIAPQKPSLWHFERTWSLSQIFPPYEGLNSFHRPSLPHSQNNHTRFQWICVVETAGFRTSVSCNEDGSKAIGFRDSFSSQWNRNVNQSNGNSLKNRDWSIYYSGYTVF